MIKCLSGLNVCLDQISSQVVELLFSNNTTPCYLLYSSCRITKIWCDRYLQWSQYINHAVTEYKHSSYTVNIACLYFIFHHKLHMQTGAHISSVTLTVTTCIVHLKTKKLWILWIMWSDGFNPVTLVTQMRHCFLSCFAYEYQSLSSSFVSWLIH